MERWGGEGESGVGRNLCTRPYTEKAKLKKESKWNNWNVEEEDPREVWRW
jgi:hypothetical protein